MPAKTCLLPVEILHGFIRDAFIHMGVPQADAEICSEILITSDLRGIESHGIGRLKYYYDRITTGQTLPVTQFEVVRETPATALVDGHCGMGHVIGYKAMCMAIEKARIYGVGVVAVRNSSHFGIDGYYPLMAVDEGMVGMSFTNARPSIAPTFGVQPKLGTNPIAFGAPSDEAFPFLFDAATSISQRGKFEVLERVGKPALSGWVTDQYGQDVIDPSAVLRGLSDDTNALLPLGGAGETLGGHKGYGLATMVEILSASFQSGMFLYSLMGINEDGKKVPNRLGHYFQAINIEAFVSLDEFRHTTGCILRELRAARKAPGCDHIYTAGEKEYLNEQRVRREGVPVNPELQKEIRFLVDTLQIPGYHFPF